MGLNVYADMCESQKNSFEKFLNVDFLKSNGRKVRYDLFQIFATYKLFFHHYVFALKHGSAKNDCHANQRWDRNQMIYILMLNFFSWL